MTRTVLEFETSSYPIYGSQDLAYFQRILDDMLNEIRGADSVTELSEEDLVLRIRLAAAIFKAAEDGEREAVRIKQKALAMIGYARPRAWPRGC